MLASLRPAPLSRAAPSGCSGFALLITIVLLAFLVLLLVSLASLTRVEAQIAGNNQHLSQARQNALLALNVAVGELQKYVGPDQRTTARADIDASLADTTTAHGRWLGAYGSRVAASYADTPDQIANKLTAAGTDPLLSKGSQAILLNWLVSGNEKTAFDPETDVAMSGNISLTTAPTITFTPTASPVDLTAVNVLPSIADTTVLLVGDASVETPADRVAAPLVRVTVPESMLPGFSSTSTADRTIGRYAWWAGDENAKAPAHLDSLAPPPPGGTATDPDHAFVVAQRAAIELADSAAAYDPANPGIRTLLHIDQLPMLNAASAASLDALRKQRYHDITVSSLSLLTDTYAGGLRKDLSSLLGTGAAGPADGDYLFTPPSNSALDTFGMPTWGKLRSFARQTSDGSALSPRQPSTTDVGIAPVLTFAEIGLEYFKPTETSVQLAVLPRAVLWNPYTVPLAPARYEFGVNIAATTGLFQLQGKRPADPGFSAKGPSRYLGRAAGTAPDTIANGYLRFVINVTEPIPPGESHIFVLPGSGNYTASYNQAPSNVLTRGILPGYAIIPDAGATAEPDEVFRVAGDGANHLPPQTGRSFRNNASAYLGEVSSTGPDGPLWPAPDKPWYQVIGRAGEPGGTSYAWLQGGALGGDLLSAPGTNLWGIQVRLMLATRLRYIANTNPRAAFFSGPPYQNSRAVVSAQGTSLAANDFDPSPDARASAALSFDVIAGQPVNNTLFEFRPSDRPLLSLGQLQHANLSFLVDEPGYPIGNSLAPYIHLNADKTNRNRLHRTGSTAAVPPSNLLSGHYDISYLLNRALWDRYFVSTIPHAGTGAAGDTDATSIPDVLANPRLVRQSNTPDADLRDADKAAAHLFINGGFNINSTSEQAWRAILGGLNRLSHNAAGTLDASLDAALPRFAQPLAAAPISGTRPDWAFAGYRRLSQAQITALAANIVSEIRNRGPFISLGDFVNRRLRDNPATTTPSSGIPYNADETLSGPLQNAIDGTPVTGASSINNSRNLVPFKAATSIDANAATTELDGDAMRGGPVVISHSTPQFPSGAVAAFAPQFLTQADVLSAIGPSLSARSDTFTLRTYGEVQNPATGEITGRAWCEAVVQRTVEPLRRRSSDSASPDYHEPAAAAAGQPDFGRRFQIISFRWLSSTDI